MKRLIDLDFTNSKAFSDLEIYVTIFEFIKDAEMKILAVTEDVVSEAVEIGRLYRLLPNDA